MFAKHSPAAVILGSALLLGLGMHGAKAAPMLCTSTITLPGGNGFVDDFLLTPGVCVQTLDVTFGAFALTGLPADGRVGFNTTNIGSPLVAQHTVSFNDNFQPLTTYSMSYSAQITSGSNVFKALNADFTQTGGTSTLDVLTTPHGVGSIDWTKVVQVGSGPDLITYGGNQLLVITNTLIDNGSVSSVTNNLVENRAVGIPEPASLVLLGAGMIGLLTLRRRTVRATA